MEKKNNFNILRLIFSSFVIISHSYPLTGNEEFFHKYSNHQVDLGSLSVNIFFIISGFLIFNSLFHSKSILNYLWKRTLRLFPALFIMLIITMVIILFVNTSHNIFEQRDFYTYLPNNLSLYNVQYAITGVFENNPYPKSINGSLWSLRYEFTMYLLILPFFCIKKFKRTTLFILIIIFCASSFCHLLRPNFLKNILGFLYLNSIHFYRLLTFFIMGAILSFVNISRIRNNFLIIIIAALLIISIYLNVYKYSSLILLPVIIILIGLSYNKLSWNLTNKTGDLSYGIYIYGFLIQQTLMNFYKLDPLELMFFSFLIAIPVSYLSWGWVEKKSLKYKNYF